MVSQYQEDHWPLWPDNVKQQFHQLTESAFWQLHTDIFQYLLWFSCILSLYFVTWNFCLFYWNFLLSCLYFVIYNNTNLSQNVDHGFGWFSFFYKSIVIDLNGHMHNDVIHDNILLRKHCTPTDKLKHLKWSFVIYSSTKICIYRHLMFFSY